MNALGIRLTLLIGSTVPLPAPSPLLEALENVEVTHNDEERSGFQITFKADRSGVLGTTDYPLLKLPLLQPFNRVILIVTFNAIPYVLLDGIITHQELSPTAERYGMLVVTGEDVSVMMDLEEKIAAHPAQPDTAIVSKLILSYAQYGLTPQIIPPLALDIPNPIDRVPIQRSTDLEYIQQLAARHGYVFYITPGPLPGTNTAYWGPPKRLGIPQRALSVNLGSTTNVESINFQHNALTPTFVAGKGQDNTTNKSLPVQTLSSTRPPLATQSALLKTAKARKTLPKDFSCLNYTQMQSRAQTITDTSMDRVVTVNGELDTQRYNGILQSRSLVGLRGAGSSYDGFYYVKSVTHNLRPGEYKQSFTLTREGVGTTTAMVIP